MSRPRSSRGRRLVIIAALLVAVPAGAVAQERVLGGKFRAGDEVVISADETIEGDLYVSAGSVRIDGTVEGDLVAGSGTVDVDGEVMGDALVGSGSVDISGQVGGDVRAGAGQVMISGSIGEDLVTGAGQVTIEREGEVGEDFVVGAGRVTLDGRVGGDVLGRTGNYTRSGTVGGTENVAVTRREEAEAPTFEDRLLGALRRFVGLLAVSAILLWLVPWSIEGAARTFRRRPLASLGVGALGLIGSVLAVIAVVVVAVLLAIVLGLIGLGGLVGLTTFSAAVAVVVLAFLLFVALAYAVQAAVGVTLAELVLGPSAGRRRWVALVLGVLVVVILTSLPVVGGWLTLLIALLGLGALLLVVTRRGERPATQ